MRRLKHTEIKPTRIAIQTAQNNECAICSVSFTDAKIVKKKLVPKYISTLDHDHTTGVIRGVLCNSCNGNEGRIRRRAMSAKRDGTELQWLKRLVAYLELHEQPQTTLLHPTHKSADEKRLAQNKKARQRRAQAKALKVLAGNNNGTPNN
ncbi:MAG: hypothetical protein KAS32_11900 [Candidatus Peribacteraceae bacterium]|nr:hypothetical protein [Candidatus Peribacteraceae bacterium]